MCRFAIIKVITIVGLIILGVVIDAGATPSREVIGLNRWYDPGPWVQFHGVEGALGRFLGQSRQYKPGSFWHRSLM